VNRYIAFFSVVTLLSAIIGFGFDGQVPNIFRIIFVGALDLVIVLLLAKVFVNVRQKRKLKKNTVHSQDGLKKVNLQGQTA